MIVEAVGDLQEIIPDVLRSTSVAVCEHGAVLVEVATGTVHHLAEPVDPAVADMIAAADGDEMVVYEATIGLPANGSWPRQRAPTSAVATSSPTRHRSRSSPTAATRARDWRGPSSTWTCPIAH